MMGGGLNMIIDSFIFNNEISMLKYRLSVLSPYVDYFVLCESTHTFSGHEKELYYHKNKHLFEEYESKIVHVIVDDFEYLHPIDYTKVDEYGYYTDGWANEKKQRNDIARGLDRLTIQDDDFIILGDVDEIPNPNCFGELKLDEINVLKARTYYYNLNCVEMKKYTDKCCRIFTKPILKRYGNLQEIRTSMGARTGWSTAGHNIIEKSAWHLSYFGDSDFILNKLKSFSHCQDSRTKEITESSDPHGLVAERLSKSMDLFVDRNTQYTFVPLKDNTDLPLNYEKLIDIFDFELE